MAYGLAQLCARSGHVPSLGATRSILIARSRHARPDRPGAINGPLHESGRLCLLDEFVDVGEPPGIALRNGNPIDICSVVVFQHARATLAAAE